ncbi:MAG TPA: hypothetical protein VGG85_17535 [Terracidiphilus sp.]|jgi:hypothetical protein
MRKNPSAWPNLVLALLLLVPGGAFALPADAAKLVDQAQQQVVDYVGKLADLHCTEDVVQEKLRANNNVEVSRHFEYDYFLYMQGNSYDFQLSESRLEIGTAKPAHTSMLLSNGFSTLLLVFHPYYRNGFEFSQGPAENRDGRFVVPVHFVHISGARSPAAMALRGREYPLDLEGTAWLDASTGQVVRMDAGLAKDLTDVGLRTFKVQVDYAPSPNNTDRFMVPARAVVDLETPRQHWRNIHTFHNYKTFSAEATQDPAVKVKTPDGAADPQATPQQSPPNLKEQP